ncbi:MAG: SNF2 helicase associated domain-containing protein [Clostridia bacterium]|nr:SNF2 helicase associated domain-containing protein [Clostridia bacterium]
MLKSGEVERFNEMAGEMRTFRAKRYFREGRVHIDEISEIFPGCLDISANVEGKIENFYSVDVEIVDGEVYRANCTCDDSSTICKHILATLYALEAREVEEFSSENRFEKLLSLFSVQDNPNKEGNGDIRIVPYVIEDEFGGYAVGFKIGRTQFYNLKNLSQFSNAVRQEQRVYYGKKLEFVHTKSAFDTRDLKLLEFILTYTNLMEYAKTSYGNYWSSCGTLAKFNLHGRLLDDFFELFVGRMVEFSSEECLFTDLPENPLFAVKRNEKGKCEISFLLDNCSLFAGEKYLYLKTEDCFFRCPSEKAGLIKFLLFFSESRKQRVEFEEKELPEFFSVIQPFVSEYVATEALGEELVEKYKPKELAVKVLLDMDKAGSVIADIRFCYGDFEFNPFADLQFEVARNKRAEEDVMQIFHNSGFQVHYENKNMLLTDEERIYGFLTNDINYYMEKFEVLATEALKARKLKQPKLSSIGVKVTNNLLEIQLADSDFDLAELSEIMKRYQMKKKYYRLKDGSFLSLSEEDTTLRFLDNLTSGAEFDFKNIKNGRIRLPVYRGLYFDKLLADMGNVQIEKAESYKDLVTLKEDNETLPNSMESILRVYQKKGYQWLKTLEHYHLGGILADDMGLGKTLQMIAVILKYVEDGGDKPSIVVCPSSLALNWENEIHKFAGGLRTLVMTGNATYREGLLENYNQYDVVITSYDLLKRDIDLYEERKAEFKFAVIDEAQYIKNSNTQNARAVKRISAETKFALTGTPIENSLSELWSIFDFVMPGYLFGYSKFKKNYELPIVKEKDEASLNRLKMLIEPFILRRNKKEVLTELPEKTVSILYNEMQEEQKKLYLAYLANAKQDLWRELEHSDFEKNKLKILALLTRLRQIVCHPALFLKEYKAGSGKLEQCMEIISEAVSGGHKILLFSGFTSMFGLIEKELSARGISYFELTGQTKVNERIKLVDEFNKNEDVKVFLISLKAGGTGLNLTGADVVIHYDPWWNLAAENQATDRAYRIGQKNNVQVYKLITKNSLEEKIHLLQEKKNQLIDDVLSTEEVFINQLSKEDILSLFE